MASSLRPAPATACALALALALASAAGAATGVSPAAFPGVSISVGVNRCTGAFVLVTRSHRPLLATAGHCVDTAARPDKTTPAGDRVWTPGHGPVVTDSRGHALGRVTFAAVGTGVDFALIELSKGVSASNTVPGFGRITHVNANPEMDAQIRLYGQGVAVAAATPERTGVVTGVEPSIVRLAIVSVPGDSGGPVYDPTFGAVGILMGADVSVTPPVGIIRASRLSAMLVRATRALNTPFTLARD